MPLTFDFKFFIKHLIRWTGRNKWSDIRWSHLHSWLFYKNYVVIFDIKLLSHVSLINNICQAALILSPKISPRHLTTATPTNWPAFCKHPNYLASVTSNFKMRRVKLSSYSLGGNLKFVDLFPYSLQPRQQIFSKVFCNLSKMFHFANAECPDY